MSFSSAKAVISEGDKVIVYLTVNSMHAIDVVPQLKNKKGEMVENVFQTSFGALKVKNLIGHKYGSKVELSKGWAYVFQTSPELWTLTLPHRTQIIYTPDISMILLQLEVRPGSVVIESGTGSGSLSHYFIRACQPDGHLHTFDFHEARVEQARDEFQTHGIGDYVTAYHRDVCTSGFTETLNGSVDAVFLDLPLPWMAIPYAVKALKSEGGRFCSFSPCIEQTQKCCETLEAHGFLEIDTIEVIQSEDTVRVKNVPIMDLEFVKHKKPILNEHGGQDKDSKTVKETKKYITANGPQSMPGHTGFLTFATWPPRGSL